MSVWGKGGYSIEEGVWQKKKQEQLCLLPLHYDLETLSTEATFSACL